MKLEPSPFDTRIFACSIGRLVVDPTDGAADLEAALDEARARYAVLFLRTTSTHPVVEELARRGHRPVDRLVTSTLRSTSFTQPASVGDVAIEHVDKLDDELDVATVAAFTAETMRTSHFHADPRLSPESTRQLFQEWARNDVTGRARRTIVARAGREIVGFVAIVIAGSVAIIDLVSVTPTWQGRGIGGLMLASFVEWVASTGLEATVGTQVDNPAQRLYERYGFVPTSEHLTYHLWLT